MTPIVEGPEPGSLAVRAIRCGWMPPGRGQARLRSLSGLVCVLAGAVLFAVGVPTVAGEGQLPKVRVRSDGRGFVTSDGRPFVPMGVNYFRPGTGWAPQVWKQFDEEATRRDFARLRALGANCVRVFLTYGSFHVEPGRLSEEGLARFDRFLALAEEAGLYVHPTGPDHWEGLPPWARVDRIADEQVLTALERWWRQWAARYRGRSVIFAYDLLNEPEVGWDTRAMHVRWNAWLKARYGGAGGARGSGVTTEPLLGSGDVPVPARDAAPGRELLDFQHCRERVAVEWTRRQVEAIRSADPDALVTVGLIQWSVPVCIAGAWHYSGFRPELIAPWVDFMEVHFYPLARGFYQYRSVEEEAQNLAYLDLVVGEVSRPGKPVVLAEFGWYGGGQPSLDGGPYAFASEEQQARWCRQVMERTAGPVCGWLNWGLYDHPEARDVTQLTGLLTAEGREKAWAREFRILAERWREGLPAVEPARRSGPPLDWDRLITDPAAREAVYWERIVDRASVSAGTGPAR